MGLERALPRGAAILQKQRRQPRCLVMMAMLRWAIDTSLHEMECRQHIVSLGIATTSNRRRGSLIRIRAALETTEFSQ